MPLIVTRIPRTRQPQGGVRPAARYADMHAGLIGGQAGMIGAAGGTWTRDGTPIAGVSSQGLTWRAPGYLTAGRHLGAQVDGSALAWPGITVVAVLETADIANGSFPGIVSLVPAAGGEYYGICNLTVEFGAARSIYWRAGDSGTHITPSVYGVEPSVDEWSVGDRLVIVARWDKSTTRIAVSRNGLAATRNSAGHSTGWRSGIHETAVGGYVRIDNRMAEHKIALAAVIPRDVGAIDEASLLENPLRLFAPIERRIWVPSAGGAVPSITAVYADSVTASSVVPRVTLDFA